MGLLDLGVSTSVSRSLTKYKALESKEKITKLIGSANSIFLIVGLVGLIIFSTAGIIGHFFISQSLVNYKYYPLALIAAGLLFLTTSASGLFLIIPTAMGRFDLSNKVGLISITLQQTGIVITILMNYSIATIFIVQFLIAIITGILSLNISKKILSVPIFHISWDKREIIEFYKFGLTVFANNLTGSSLTYLDRIIIPFLLGPSNLTYYSLPGNITSKTPGIANAVSGTLFPTAAHLESLGDIERIKTLYIRSTRLILITSTAITIGIASFPYEILRYWINIDTANHGSIIMVILAFTSLILAILSPISNLLLGLGKLKSLTITSIIMSITNAILLFMLIPQYGIIGAAWAYILSLIPVLWLIYEVESKHLGLGRQRIRYHIITLFKLTLTSIIVYFFNICILKIFVSNLISMVIIGPVSVLSFLITYNIFGFFEKDDKADIKKFIIRFFKKNK